MIAPCRPGRSGLIAADTEADERDRRRFRDFADRSAARMAQIDWDQAWH
jgi:hypothetical protein